MLGVDSDVVTSASPPGRGILDGHETQIAVLGGDGNVAVQARELDALGQAMSKAGVPDAPAVERLADFVPLAALQAQVGPGITIGIADDTLRPVYLEPIGPFVIAGPPGSGRTTAIGTLAQALATLQPATELYLLAPRRSPLLRRAVWKNAAHTPTDVERVVQDLARLADSGSLRPGQIGLFLENLSDFAGAPVEYELERVVKSLLKQEQFIVGESETSTWSQAYTLGQPLRAGRKGLLLQPDDSDGDLLLNTSIGRVRRGSLPVGRGFLIAQGRARKLQVAIVAEESVRATCGVSTSNRCVNLQPRSNARPISLISSSRG